MDLPLWRRQEYAALYNCSLYRITDLPFEQRQKLWLGVSMLVLFVVAETLYLPCLLVIWRQMRQSCYKIMFFIGVTDVCALCIVALESGIFAIQGAVFCSYPTLIYWSGMLGDMFWSLESTAATLLAANRCIIIALPELGECLFHGGRTWIWLGSVFCYSFCYGFLTNPIVFSSVTFTWYFNPHVGYIQGVDELYANNLDAIHSGVVACIITLLYLLFIVLVIVKKKSSPIILDHQNQISSTTNSTQQQTKMIFLQVFLISLVNTVGGASYAMMAVLPYTELLGYLGTYTWAFCHSIPPVIYLCINRRLRAECIKMVCGCRLFNNYYDSRSNGTQQIHPTSNNLTH